MNRGSISVLIPTLNGGKLFRRCLESLSKQKTDAPVEIVVVDSGSTDSSDKVAESYGRVIRIDRSEFNHGDTRNLGVSQCGGDLVALLVQDAVPCDDLWLQRLADNFADPKVAGAYSRQLPHTGANPIVAARLKRWSAGGARRVEKKIDDIDKFEKSSPLEKVDLVAFDNVSSMIRKSVWEKIKFPRASFGEDTGWSLAVLKAGWKIVYEPQSVVWHSHSNSLWYEFKRVYMDHQNWNRLVGLKLFPMPLEIFRAGFNGVFERWNELDEIEMSALEKSYWKMWSVPYSFSQNAAQFLGAISPKWLETKPWFGRFDKIFKKGV